MRFTPWMAWLGLLAACGAPVRETPSKKPAPAVKPADESRRFPIKNRVRIELLENQLLGRAFLPGGNLAEYRLGGRTYQQFLVRAGTADQAALLMFDFQKTLKDARFLAHMGGYFGRDGEAPVYVFAKGVFFAGFVGLEEKQADLLAREFAARL